MEAENAWKRNIRKERFCGKGESRRAREALWTKGLSLPQEHNDVMEDEEDSKSKHAFWKARYK